MIKKDSNYDYHHKGGFSSSKLKGASTNMLQWKHDQENKSFDGSFGSLVHCLYLEPNQLENDFIVYSESDRPDQKHSMSAKANVEWLENLKLQAEAEHKQGVVSNEQILQAHEMVAVAKKHPLIDKWLNPAIGQAELSFYQKDSFVDHFTGKSREVDIKCRPDKFFDFGNEILIVDIKTASKVGGASLDGFMRICKELEYHMSASFYCDIVQKEMREQMRNPSITWAWFVQETVPPYNYNWITAGVDLLALGRKTYEKAIENILMAELHDLYPSYMGMGTVDGTTMTIPKWFNEPQSITYIKGE